MEAGPGTYRPRLNYLRVIEGQRFKLIEVSVGPQATLPTL